MFRGFIGFIGLRVFIGLKGFIGFQGFLREFFFKGLEQEAGEPNRRLPEVQSVSSARTVTPTA